MVLIAPALPPFLAESFELKAIEGVPDDEEVKAVHAVIRALSGFSHMKNLYDAQLAMQLSQHLFAMQMIRFRDKYPMAMFQMNTTHIPPTLPTHIVVDLKPVTGTPSDEDIQQAQEALRLSEGAAVLPSMFSAELCMELSQHVFNLQFDRCLRQMSLEHETTSRASIQQSNPSDVESEEVESVNAIRTTGDNAEPSAPLEAALTDEPTPPPSAPAPIPAPAPAPEPKKNSVEDKIAALRAKRAAMKAALEPKPESSVASASSAPVSIPVPTPPEPPKNSADERAAAPRAVEQAVSTPIIHQPDMSVNEFPQESNADLQQTSRDTEASQHRRLEANLEPITSEIKDTNNILSQVMVLLKDIKQVMVSSQNVMARGLNGTYFGGRQVVHSVINEKGEYPELMGIPHIGSISRGFLENPYYMVEGTLAQHLQFYGLGDGLVEEGDQPLIKQGMKDKAITKLRQFLCSE